MNDSSFNRRAFWIVLIFGTIGLVTIQLSGLGPHGIEFPSWLGFNPPPFKVSGLHVLVVEDLDARGSMTADQIAALEGADVRTYLDEHCAKGSDGKTAAVRFLSEDTTPENLALDEPWLKDAWAQYQKDSKGKLPWAVVNNGKTWTSEAYPGSVADALTLFKRYGE